MSQGVTAFGRSTASREPVLKRLSQRHDLPPRVRNILRGLLGLCAGNLDRLLVTALDEFERDLFEQASKARSNELSHRYFESMREVKRARAEVAPRFRLAIEGALTRFDQPRDSGTGRSPAGPPPSAELSLVDTADLEESLALQDIARKSEVRHVLALHDLGHRFGVLAAQPAFDADSVPLGPAQIMAAVGHASACLNIPVETRVLLYHTYERVAAGHIGAFYDAINAFLVEQNVLKHLRVYVPVRSKGKSGAGPQEASANFDAAHAPAAGFVAAHTPAAGIGAGRAPAAGIGTARVPAAGSGAAGTGGSAMPAEGGQPQQTSAGAHADERDAELFTTLRELLVGKRTTFGPPTPEREIGRGYVPSSDEVQSALHALQSAPIIPATKSDGVDQRSMPQLKRGLLDQLRQFAPPGQKPQLNSEDSDTVDLVGMLFDYIKKSSRANGVTQAMLAKLHVPLLRVALRDKSFFTRRSHPARQLLNAIADTGIYWIDDSETESDPALLKKMHTVVERLTAEFDGDLSLFEHMLGDLTQHMHALARKAAAAERRLVDASKGREKLALARETAGNAIAERISAARPKRLLRTMLERAWTDVLALTLLREGESSDAYRKQLAVADQLIAAGLSARETDKPPAASLRREVEKGLGEVGYHRDEIQAVVTRLLTPERVANEENPSSQTSIAMKLKSKSHHTETPDEEKPMHAAALRRASLRLNAEEERMLERLKTVPFGTWFEFTTNQQGDRVRRKLSWFSPQTGHCLFVNQRGERAKEITLEQLARDIVRDQASIVKPEQESLVDRAWNAIVTSLKQLTGHPADAQPVPA